MPLQAATAFLTTYKGKGLLAFVILVLCWLGFPHIAEIARDYRADQRMETEYNQSTYEKLYEEEKAERKRTEADVDYYRGLSEDLRSDMRMERRADDRSMVSKWTLDRDLELTWWNVRFTNQVFRPMNVNPLTARNKTWFDLLPEDVATQAHKTDFIVKETLKPLSYSNGFSIETRGDGIYKVFWYVIKEPLIDDYGNFAGIRGTASPHGSEKISDLPAPSGSR